MTNPVQSVRDLGISVDADLVMGKMNGNLCFCTCVRITTAFQTDLAWTIYMRKRRSGRSSGIRCTFSSSTSVGIEHGSTAYSLRHSNHISKVDRTDHPLYATLPIGSTVRDGRAHVQSYS